MTNLGKEDLNSWNLGEGEGNLVLLEVADELGKTVELRDVDESFLGSERSGSRVLVSVVAEGEIGEDDSEVRESRRGGLSKSCSVLKKKRGVASSQQAKGAVKGAKREVTEAWFRETSKRARREWREFLYLLGRA